MAKVKKSAVTAKLEAKQTVTGALPVQTSIYGQIGANAFPYPEKTVEEYRAKLDKMDMADMERHAVSVAHILPSVHKRAILIDKLVVAYLRKQAQQIQDPNRYSTPEIPKGFEHLFNRGR